MLLDYIWLVFEVLDEVCHEFISVINYFDVLSDDPDDGGLGFGIIEVVQVLADVCEQPLILVWVFSEYVADDDDCFLNDIGYFSFESFPKALDALIGHFLQFDSALTHGVDCLSDKLHIYLMNVLLQFMQNHENVLIVGYLRQHFQFLQLHIKWIMIIYEKDLELLGKK